MADKVEVASDITTAVWDWWLLNSFADVVELLIGTDVYTDSMKMYEVQKYARELLKKMSNPQTINWADEKKKLQGFVGFLARFNLTNEVRGELNQLIKEIGKGNPPSVESVKALLTKVNDECRRYAEEDSTRIKPLVSHFSYLLVAAGIALNPTGAWQATTALHKAMRQALGEKLGISNNCIAGLAAFAVVAAAFYVCVKSLDKLVRMLDPDAAAAVTSMKLKA